MAVGLAASWPADASAYSWMIQHGYAACGACHADPSGGSLLTRYGRAQGELLLRTHYKRVPAGQEQEPGRVSEFLFGVKTPEPLLLGGDLRTAYMGIKPDGAGWQRRWVFMQVDATGQIAYKRVRAFVSLGYAHDSAPGSYSSAATAAITRGSPDRLISRAHWLGVDLGEENQWLIRGGRMNVPYGLRLVEHTMWVRNVTRTDTDAAQQHGVSAAYTSPKLRGEAMVILGNYQLAPDKLRERGYGAFLEWVPVDRLAVGAASLVTHAAHDLQLQTPLWRHAHGLFARFSPIKRLALLGEVDLTLLSQPPGTNRFGIATMVQADYEVLPGVHVMVTWEGLDRALGDNPLSTGVWGSLVWFFAPHVDVRFDAVWRSVAEAGPRTGAVVLLGQLHLFL